MTKTIYHTLETIHALCVEYGDCWEWQRSLNSQKMPQTRHGGKIVSVRKLAYQLAGHKVKGKNVVFPTCNNRKCVNPAHIQQTSVAIFMREQNKLRVKSLTTKQKLSTIARKHSKLTPELVEQIRSGDKSQRQWARETGITQKTIWQAANGMTWKEYASPWSGLGQR
jgi:hypothetical protein